MTYVTSETENRSGSVRLWGRRRRRVSLVALCQQTDLIDTRRADFVYNGDHVAILGARVALHIDGLFQPAGDAVLHFSGNFFFLDLRVAQENVAVAGNRYDDGILFIGILHVLVVVSSAQIYPMNLL